MSTTKKLNFAQVVRETLKESADALTKQELMQRVKWDMTGSTISLSEKMSNALRDQVRGGYMESETDHLGVTRYKLTGVEPQPSIPPHLRKKGAYSITKKTAQERVAKKQEEEMNHEAKAKSDINKLKREMQVTDIPFDYQEAYNRGYNDAMFHSHRDAYNAGRQSVLKGLMKLLNIKGEVLL